jgi:hypothetical protein
MDVELLSKFGFGGCHFYLLFSIGISFADFMSTKFRFMGFSTVDVLSPEMVIASYVRLHFTNITKLIFKTSYASMFNE